MCRRGSSRLASRHAFRYDVNLQHDSMKGVAMSEINKEKLMSDIKTVLADAEDLLTM